MGYSLKTGEWETGVYLSSPTNSTMFTKCCDTAILSRQKNCPSCDRPIIGADCDSESERDRLRWSSAFRG